MRGLIHNPMPKSDDVIEQIRNQRQETPENPGVYLARKELEKIPFAGLAIEFVRGKDKQEKEAWFDNAVLDVLKTHEVSLDKIEEKLKSENVLYVIAAAVEAGNDEGGITWPVSIAPFHVVITPVNIKDQELLATAERIYAELRAAGVEALLDDRDERAGVKFNDADLIGVPYRITVGKKVKEGKVELMTRSARQSEDVAVDSVVATLGTRIQAAMPA